MTVRQKTGALLRRVLPSPAYRLVRRAVTRRGSVSSPPGEAPRRDYPPPPVREIDNLRDLDEALARAEAAFAVSEDDGRKVLDAFRYAPVVRVPSDPYSEEYREAQLRMYAHVSGRAGYEARVSEHSEFDLAAARERPFPYMTASAEAVGTQLMKQGFVIRHLGVPAGSRIVEFGSGWGNLTLHLAQMGHSVTAVEIEPAFCDLVRSRAARLGVTIEVVERDMLEFAAAAPYDAAVFFESLHHCADHVRMLRNLDRIVTSTGVAIFATEPIGEYPNPWGVRFDGLSVWSMRRFGWLELGFDASYFLRTLLLLGWLPTRHVLAECAGADVVVARRAHGVYEPHRLSLPPDEDRTWAHPGAEYLVAGDRSLLTCARNRPVSAVEFSLGNLGSAPAAVVLQAGGGERTVRLAAGAHRETVVLPVERWDGRVSVGAPASNVAVHMVRLRDPGPA